MMSHCGNDKLSITQ